MKRTEFDWGSGRVTTWNIDDLDLSKGIASQVDLLAEDLVQVRFGDHVILDLGWYPEFDPEGHFVLNVIKDEDWETPTTVLRFKNLAEFQKNMSHVIALADRLSK
jgi:hypothetical protein